MKKRILFFLPLCMASYLVDAQTDPPRGPYNISPNGVVDGVSIKDEVPVRSAVEYEYVRSSDLVWNKRVFSRIDVREKINHDIFFPNDYFSDGWKPPMSVNEIDKKDWVKHQERWSLWTIIMRHLMLGDLTCYDVADWEKKLFTAVEDGYNFKYPINKKSKDEYFDLTSSYRVKINRKLSFGGPGPIWKIDRPNSQDTWPITRFSDKETFDQWFDRLTTKGDSANLDPADYDQLTREPKDILRAQYDLLKTYENMRREDVVQFISSASIIAYNIKEDWFFDKERSLLDRRIIAIAPVARLKLEEQDDQDPGFPNVDGIERFPNVIGVSRDGFLIHKPKDGDFEVYDGPMVERELFWLYFPELRNVMVNYYIYNDQNDAQWMSFDDMFWKRRFSGQIYRVSDKFDREIEDYKFGVDALYEAERIKEQIREWEINVWNY